MSQEEPNGRAPAAREFEGVLRRPDGSVDVAAYAKIAHRERAAAVTFSMRETIRRLRGMSWAIGTRLAAVGRPRPASGGYGTPVAR